ncbi:hypothetical protein D3C78_1744390 [compost metagenome]
MGRVGMGECFEWVVMMGTDLLAERRQQAARRVPGTPPCGSKYLRNAGRITGRLSVRAARQQARVTLAVRKRLGLREGRGFFMPGTTRLLLLGLKCA